MKDKIKNIGLILALIIGLGGGTIIGVMVMIPSKTDGNGQNDDYRYGVLKRGIYLNPNETYTTQFSVIEGDKVLFQQASHDDGFILWVEMSIGNYTWQYHGDNFQGDINLCRKFMTEFLSYTGLITCSIKNIDLVSGYLDVFIMVYNQYVIPDNFPPFTL